ncbi:hypothetical protein ADIAL_0703 [Alkalibacterium sp. AK22]|uniref:hypothetical protein n=1 Tax=Alkalibacterium sp. AK22 TaxID=1229520 RepID=UPI000450417A|nr:hypothetical protein [Alkalibacterium sp. AK22]EXJ23911.1 hypothetical protein ADIAL_0703 [Alkalibacterium sp. AK22]
MKHVRAEWIILTLSLTLFGCRGEVDSSNSQVTEETEGSVPALSSEGLYLEPLAVSVQAGGGGHPSSVRNVQLVGEV